MVVASIKAWMLPIVIRRFLDPQQNVCTQAVQLLTEAAKGTDLSQFMVIVPTAEAGRRLGEALAQAAAREGRGLLSPTIITPKQLLAPAAQRPGFAEPASCLFAWSNVLQSIDPSAFPNLFPTLPERSHAWLWGMAERFFSLQGELNEHALDFQAVAEAVQETPFDTLRWAELARLEALFRQELRHRTLEDPFFLERSFAQDPEIPPQPISRVILCAVPSPLPLAVQTLQAMTEKALPVEIWIHADASREGDFDAWGRPLSEAWRRATSTHLETIPCTSPQECLDQLVEALTHENELSQDLGMADSRLSASAQSALKRAGIPAHDPSGIPASTTEVGILLSLLLDAAEHAEIECVRSLLQFKRFWRSLDTHPSTEDAPSQEYILRKFDQLCEKYLPIDLAKALEAIERDDRNHPAAPVLRRLKAIQQQLTNRSTSLANALSECLANVYAQAHFRSGSVEARHFREQAKAVRKVLSTLASSERQFPELERPLAFRLVRKLLRESRVYEERDAHARDLIGWLELPWAEPGKLIICGLNEGVVPQSVQGDAFLPEVLRQHLGMLTNETRLANDTYLLDCLCQQRNAPELGVRILVAKQAVDGSPLKPSRLLFQCEDDALISRVSALFSQHAAPTTTRERPKAPFQLRPPGEIPLPESLPISGLAAYLDCPFHFFLKNTLKMREVRTDERELSAAAFGSILHETTECLSGLTVSSDSQRNDIAKHLRTTADRIFAARYGAPLPFALLIQRDSLYARLDSLARLLGEQARDEADTTIADVEMKIEYAMSGMLLRGRLDRLDRLADGSIRLVDYKTSDNPKPPNLSHLKPLGRTPPSEHLPAECFIELAGKAYQWTDLQLPLYAAAIREQEGQLPSVAYCNLSQSAENSQFHIWHPWDDALVDAAVACAEAIVQSIKAGKFWPPNPKARYVSDFAHLFPNGLETDFDGSDLFNFKFSSPSETGSLVNE